ncbi:MAG TPA: VWA domain-containing protein [Candidatus Azoamicus sp.]
MLNFIKNIIKNNNVKNESSLLDINIKRFEYISNSISKKKIEILESNDNIGSYYQNKIILPKNINISKNEKINIKCFLYKILFSTISNNKNYYLSENKNNLNYILLTSMLTVKTINKQIKYIYPNFKNLIRDIHPIIIRTRKNYIYENQSILELILKKLMYEKSKKINILTKDENLFIYKIENIYSITKISLKSTIKRIYEYFKCIQKKNETINLNVLWGYLYYKEKYTNEKEIKNFIKQTKNKSETLIQKNTIKKTEKISKNKNKNNLNLLFDYKKTIDTYKNGNKNTDQNLDENTDMLKNLDINSSIKSAESSTSILKNKILNAIQVLNINSKKESLKKYQYKEWDFKLKNYKNNWCNIFIKILQKSNNKNQTYISDIKKLYKNDIKKIREKLSLITNEKIWKKKQIHGEDIDFDTLVENYKEIKNENFNKIYKFKKKHAKNIAIIILFDSSLSTDGYIHEKKIIDFIKEISIVLSYSIKNEINKHLIATFYSNTRHDCTYKIIKHFKETNIKNNIKDIHPNGYTRIGPAIRHSIKELKNIINKKKIIILITDGNPTDYDEYEGIYGINDIKIALKEAKKNNISTKCIITNSKKNQEFTHMFKKNILILNTHVDSNKNTLCKPLIGFIKNIFTD